MTISDIKRKNKAAGRHFFDRDTLAFFKSVVYPTVYGNGYFVTRETNPSGQTRYTIRKADASGNIKTIGEFHSYRTLEDAQIAARAKADVATLRNPRRRSKRRCLKNSRRTRYNRACRYNRRKNRKRSRR